jgi:hypothetical protein
VLQLRAGIRGATDTEEAVLDLTGTRLGLDNAATAKAGARKKHVKGPVPPKPLKAVLEVTDGQLSLSLPPPEAGRGPMRSVVKALTEQGFGGLIGTADGRLLATLTLSRLDWIAELLHRPLNLSLKGAAEIDAEILLVNGLPVPGNLSPATARGPGARAAGASGGGSGAAPALNLEQGTAIVPAAGLNIALSDARLRRQDETEPSIDQVRLDADVVVADPFTDQDQPGGYGAEAPFGAGPGP